MFLSVISVAIGPSDQTIIATLSSYLNLFPETGFVYEKMKEIKIPQNNYPSYLILKGSKK
jgi:hypothetical protein